ncbi:hypothetical protein CBR_g46381 [Chara braunii]|uniref:Integrase catalytic domain-containing protein n=1 Tax=Chara braunii TaxID=69332 RepID=A0A388M0B1_CHABU|nr:hypothetical protein CBR_g46381 [Chara braunii]|eukprot:GBG88010.1 hypothetical protein CBR_g46381 [Chara braunii]
MTRKYHELTKEVAKVRQAQVANPLPLPPGSEAAIETTSAPLTVSASTSSSSVMASPSGPAAGVDSAAVVISSKAGNSATAAAPRSEPTVVGPSYAGPYVDRKAVQMSSKYDGWIGSMRAYFEILGTQPETQAVIMGMNVEPVVRGFLEVQATRAGFQKAALAKWLRTTPVAFLEDLLISQYQDPHAAARARIQFDKVKCSKWTGSIKSLQTYLSKMFATPGLELTAWSCLDVVKGAVATNFTNRLGRDYIAYTDWLTLMKDIVSLEAVDLISTAGSKKPMGGRRFKGSNRFVVHDLLEAEEEADADDPTLGDDQEKDSDTASNFMSPHGIRKVGLGMKQVALQNPCRTQVGNKEVVSSTHAVKGVRTTFDKGKTVTHALNFFVLDKCPFDAVLGLGWLQSQCEWTKWKESLFMVKDAQGNELPVLLDEKNESPVTFLNVMQFCKKWCKHKEEEQLYVAFVRPTHVPSTFAANTTTTSISDPTSSTSTSSTSIALPSAGPNDSTSDSVVSIRDLRPDLGDPFADPPPPPVPPDEQIGRFVVVYLDDIMIFSKSMEEHLKHLEEVLAILKKTQLHLNLEKPEFGKDSVIYLGHWLSAAGLEPEATKIEVIRDWPQPANIRKLRSFLGLTSYYRKFVPRFSIIARPLSRLTSKNVPYSWDVACTEAFRALKEALVSYPVLRIADPKPTFVVTTDAIQYGISAVLQQDDGDGLRPLEYYSKRMPNVKVATSTYMRELYALRMALDHWKHYLLGRHFKVFSDHETLKCIKQQTTLSPTLLRWFHEIDIFDFELRHKKGCYNRVADALSRHPEYMTCLVKSYDLRKKLKEELVEQTAKDPELSSILERLRADPSSQPDFHEYGGLIFRRYGNRDRLCVPNHEPLRTHFLDVAHGRSGHFGMAKTYTNLLRQFDWPGMKGTAEKFVAECQVCQRIKPCRQKSMGLLTPLPIPDGPWESVSIDFTDMGKVSKNGYSQVMVIVDRFSKFLNLIPLPPHAPTKLVIREFQQKYILQFGTPKTLVSDRDPRFISTKWKDFTSQLGIKLCLTPRSQRFG